jgi:hypothetical protein
MVWDWQVAGDKVMRDSRLSDWLVPVVCTIVFVAELGVVGVVFSGVDVARLLPDKTSPIVRTEAASLPLPEAVPKDESWPGPLVLPLVAPSPAPPSQMAMADWPKSADALKVEKFRHRQARALPPPRTVSGTDKYGLANVIYHPGGRAPGW